MCTYTNPQLCHPLRLLRAPSRGGDPWRPIPSQVGPSLTSTLLSLLPALPHPGGGGAAPSPTTFSRSGFSRCPRPLSRTHPSLCFENQTLTRSPSFGLLSRLGSPWPKPAHTQPALILSPCTLTAYHVLLVLTPLPANPNSPISSPHFPTLSKSSPQYLSRHLPPPRCFPELPHPPHPHPAGTRSLTSPELPARSHPLCSPPK